MGRKASLRGTTQITDLCPSLVRGITAPAGLPTAVSAYSYRRIFRRPSCEASTCTSLSVRLVPAYSFRSMLFNYLTIIIPDRTAWCQDKANFPAIPVCSIHIT